MFALRVFCRSIDWVPIVQTELKNLRNIRDVVASDNEAPGDKFVSCIIDANPEIVADRLSVLYQNLLMRLGATVAVHFSADLVEVANQRLHEVSVRNRELRIDPPLRTTPVQVGMVFYSADIGRELFTFMLRNIGGGRDLARVDLETNCCFRFQLDSSLDLPQILYYLKDVFLRSTPLEFVANLVWKTVPYSITLEQDVLVVRRNHTASLPEPHPLLVAGTKNSMAALKRMKISQTKKLLRHRGFILKQLTRRKLRRGQWHCHGTGSYLVVAAEPLAGGNIVKLSGCSACVTGSSVLKDFWDTGKVPNSHSNHYFIVSHKLEPGMVITGPVFALETLAEKLERTDRQPGIRRIRAAGRPQITFNRV